MTKAKAADYAPATRPYTLSSGRPVTMTTPPQLDLASGDINIPNQVKLDIWDLLMAGRVMVESDSERLIGRERWARAHFHMAQLVLGVRITGLADDDAEGAIDQREFSLPDLLAIYDFWRFGPPATAADNDAGPGQDAALAGGGLPPSAE